MIMMALDHASYFVAKIHYSEFWGANLVPYDKAVWFLNRLMSHICAPGFFFLMGISMVFLVQSRANSGWTNSRIKKFLITRGLLLILIESLIENPAWIMGDAFSAKVIDTAHLPGIEGRIFGNIGVLSSLGSSMIITSFIIQFHKKWLLLFSIIGIVLSYIYVNSLPSQLNQSNILYSILLIPGNWPPIRVTYSILPWLSICLLGVIWCKFYTEKEHGFFQYTFYIGLVMLCLFLLFRFLNFGNFHLNRFNGIISFLTLIKYPPGIAFSLFTLGILFILLRIFSSVKTLSPHNPIMVFGKTALFFYIIHLYIFLAMGLLFPNGTHPLIMYIFWLIGLTISYFICLGYYRFKQKKSVESIWRFF